MKAHHIKYTIEFDVPIKIEDSKLVKNIYERIEALLEQSIKTQMFYFTKEGMSPVTTKAKNIKYSHETTLVDFQI